MRQPVRYVDDQKMAILLIWTQINFLKNYIGLSNSLTECLILPMDIIIVNRRIFNCKSTICYYTQLFSFLLKNLLVTVVCLYSTNSNKCISNSPVYFKANKNKFWLIFFKDSNNINSKFSFIFGVQIYERYSFIIK